MVFTYCTIVQNQIIAVYYHGSAFAQEVDGGGTEGMLLKRSSKWLLSNHLEL